ncbi:unnamed protein product [Effrenium voratum]|nr:unnamed protein product [Effrenium voratum]
MATENRYEAKPRAYLSILSSAYFDHLEGDSLFTCVSTAGGRFECDKLLKPKGVEVVSPPPNATIEVNVMRRRRVGSEVQKQLLYRGILSLSGVRALSQPMGALKGEIEAEQPTVWEGWLGLFADPLSASGTEWYFQRCLELGSSNTRVPRLLIRLQWLPPGIPLPLSKGDRTSTLSMASLVPQAGQIQPGISNPDKEIEALRLRIKRLEKEKEDRDLCEKDIVNQARQLLCKLGPKTACDAGEAMEQAATVLREVNAKVGDMLQAKEKAAPRPQKNALCSFYKPLKRDAVDCLVAAELLRSGFEDAAEFSRVGSGQYQLGETGLRLWCYLEAGQLMARPVSEAEDQPPIEFAKFISNLAG